MRTIGLGVITGLLLAGAAPAQDRAERNLLTLAAGTVLVSASVDPARAPALIDGDPAAGWTTGTRRNPPPYSFVVELMAPASLSAVGVHGAGARPGGVTGGSARDVVVEGSATGPEAGFTELARFAAGEEGPTLVSVVPGTPVRWLRFTVEAAQDEAAPFIYLQDLMAEGRLTVPEEPDRFTGVFALSRLDLIELKQDGPAVTGCFSDNSGRSFGTVTGAVREGVAFLDWTSDQGVTGSAVLTRDSRGQLTGVRYRDRSRMAWGGPPAPEGSATACSDAPAATNPVAEALASGGHVRLYGIHFDHDSDVPLPSAQPALRQLLAALEAMPEAALEIEGHTDASGAEDYNLDLSARRAAAVVRWLTEAGIEPARLGSAGRGEAEPVASNATADGRALNRRVEARLR